MHEQIDERLRKSVSDCSWMARLKRSFFLLVLLPMIWLCLFLVMIISDALLGVNESIRYAMLGLAVLMPIVYCIRLVFSLSDNVQDIDASCRLLEDAIGDEHRRVTASLQLATMDTALAQQAVGDFTKDLPYNTYEQGLKVQPYGYVWLSIFALVACFGFIQLNWPGMISRVTARICMPWADNPPYSVTDLSIIQIPETIQYEEKTRVVVRVSGVAPEQVMLKYEHYKQTHEIYCFQIGEGTWAANIGPIKENIKIWGDCGYTRSRYKHIKIDPTPSLKKLFVTIEQPAYTNLKPQQKVCEPTQVVRVRSVAGARLKFNCLANRDISDLIIGGNGVDSLTISVSDGEAELLCPGPGKYTVTLRADGKYTSQAYPLLEIDEIPDNKPEAFINVPKSDAIATPKMIIPLELAAEDDFGVSETYRMRAHNFVYAPNLRDQVNTSMWEWTGSLDIGQLGVAVGDTITIGLYVKDNKPNGGQLSETVTRQITIVSEQSYNEFIRSKASIDALNHKYKPIIDEMNELLKKARDSKTDEERQALLKKAEELEKQIKDMQREDPLYAVEPEIQENLLKDLDAIKEALRTGDKSKLPDQKKMEQMEKELNQMKSLAKANALMEHFKALTKQQRAIAEAMKSLDDKDQLTPQEQKQLNDLGKLQEANEQSLSDWQKALKETVEEMRKHELPQATQVEKFGKKVEQSRADKFMNQSSQAASEKKAPESAENAEKAAERLESLLDECKQCQSQCQGASMGMCSNPNLAKCLSQMQSSALGSMGLSLAGTGKGGSGSSGTSNVAMMGGMNPGMAQQAQLEIFGPEQLKSNQAAMSRSNQKKKRSNGGLGDGSDEADNKGTRKSIAYKQEIRDSTAVMKVHLSTQEEKLIKEYFLQLQKTEDKDGDQP